MSEVKYDYRENRRRYSGAKFLSKRQYYAALKSVLQC